MYHWLLFSAIKWHGGTSWTTWWMRKWYNRPLCVVFCCIHGMYIMLCIYSIFLESWDILDLMTMTLISVLFFYFSTSVFLCTVNANRLFFFYSFYIGSSVWFPLLLSSYLFHFFFHSVWLCVCVCLCVSFFFSIHLDGVFMVTVFFCFLLPIRFYSWIRVKRKKTQ